MEEIAFVPKHTYTKRRLLYMGIKGENTKQSRDFSTEEPYLCISSGLNTLIMQTKHKQLLPWCSQAFAAPTLRHHLLLLSWLEARAPGMSFRQRRGKRKEKCYLKRWFSNKTLINHSSYAPQVCFSIIVLGHNHFRGLERTAKSQKGKQKKESNSNTNLLSEEY